MKDCLRCGIPHDGSYASGKFCSRKCAFKRTISSETRNKINAKLKEVWASRTKEERREQTACMQGMRTRALYLQKLFSCDFETLTLESKRFRVIGEQNGGCLHCGNSMWNAKPIKFELDHITGNRSDNSRQNLRALCPNCHSQTDTWRGNKNGNKQRRLDEVIDYHKKN